MFPPSAHRDKSSPAGREEARSAELDAGDPVLRATGLRVLGAVPWGAHICLFYETKEDLLDTASAYFAAGLEGNEFGVWAISDPITESDAKEALRQAIPDLNACLAAGQIEMLDATDWYLEGDQFDVKRVTGGWSAKLHGALARGFDGMRFSGNAFWIGTNHWKEFREYEQQLDRSLEDQKMIALCTYSLLRSRAVDLVNVVRAHHCAVARQNGEWHFLETPELNRANREIKRLTNALDILSKPFPGRELLTPRERAALAHIVRGASSKEAARALGVSPRTIEFHRANIMRKLGAKNTADLVCKVIGE